MKTLKCGGANSMPQFLSKSRCPNLNTLKLALCALIFCGLPAARASTRTWDGSASGFWTNAANWSGNIAPTNGDSLVFPGGLSRLAITNTSGAPSNFVRINFSGSNYVMFGPTLTLTNGITNAIDNFSTNVLNCPVRLGASQTWTNTSRAVLVVNSNINLNGQTLTLGSLGRFEINGGLTLSGNVVKLGNGELNFNGTNTFSGTLTLDSGPLRVDGALTSANLILNAGELDGNGSVHGFTANNGATVAPGDVTTVGHLTSTADVRFNAGAIFDVDLAGPIAGTGYDQLTVTGTVDLGGATLSRVVGFAPSPGTTFVIIDNDGTDPITNTFAGLPEGAIFTNDAVVLQITYAGGDGNDVELIVRDFAPRVWSGLGVNGLWSNASNWVGGLVPVPHDQLVFPPGAARPVNTNDLQLGIYLDAITLSGSNYVIAGNGFALDTAVTNSPAAGTNMLACDIALSLTNSTVNVGTNAALVLSGALTGNGGLAKLGIGQLTLSGANENTYSGPTTVAPGLLLLNKPAGTNAIAGPLVLSGTAKLLQNDQIADTAPITLNSGGSLDLNSKSDTVGTLTLNAGLITTLSGTLFMNGDATVSGSAAISGRLGLGAATRAFNAVDANADLLISASINGSGGIIKNGPGFLDLAASNSFSGPVTVNEGTVQLKHSFALGTTGAGTTVHSNAVLALNGSIHVGSEPLTLDSTGNAGSAGASLISSTAISNSWGGDITLLTDTAINVISGILDLAGVISGPGALTKIGSAKLALSGDNTYAGETHVKAGTLLVNGTQPASPVTVDGATLGGTGTVGAIISTNGATVAPGASPGQLNSSNVTFNPSTHFSVDLNGTISGSDYDQLNVNGSVTLDGTLTGSVGFVPDVGSTFTIINNDGSDAIQGGFQGLGEGSIFALGGFLFQLSYAGGSGGNDVVLTHVAAPPSQISSITTVTNGYEKILALGQSNLTYVIQANTNLATTNWLTIGTAQANGSGVFSFTDNNAPSFPVRFYRVQSP